MYRYRPRGNRTPVNHPILGHLSWDGVYDNSLCANNPDFELIRDKAAKTEPADTAPASTPSHATSTEPPVNPADASKPGRS